MANVTNVETRGATASNKVKPAEGAATKAKPKLALLALASALLLWASFYPLNWGWLGWIALTPLLGVVRARAKGKRVYGAALLCGIAFFVPSLQWMRVADPRMYLTWWLLSFYCSLYFPAAVFLLRFLDRRTRLPLVLTFPLVWTALELLRAHLISGFPWYYLAHTQHAFLPIIQISDITGAYGLSALVAAVNAVAFELLSRTGWFRGLYQPEPRLERDRLALPWQMLGVGALFCGFLSYGFVRIGDGQFEKGPRVVLVQPNVPQQIRNEAYVNKGNAEQDLVAQYRDLTQLAMNSGPKPALIAWPESSYPPWLDPEEAFLEHRPGAETIVAENHGEAWRLARLWHTDFLFGAECQRHLDNGKVLRYNSAILLRGDGTFAGRYDKIHRVPFGEYLPFADIPGMRFLAPYDFDYSVRAGDKFVRFNLEGKYTFGVLICYEDTDPTLAREYVRKGAGKSVDFLMNVSNDGWFDGTSQHDQHLATCRFRAVEARRAIGRSVNMGVSAVIDGNGRIAMSEPKKTEGVIACDMPIDRRTSLYAQWGDWLPWSCWIILAAAFVYGWLRPATSSSPSFSS